MPLLTREQILAAEADAPRTEDVDVPEWGGTVRVKAISGDERDRFDLFREQQASKGSDVGVRAFLVAMACVGEDGKPLFTPKDVKTLGEKSYRALDRVFDKACEVNGLGAKAIEDAVKNSEAAPSGGSG